MKLFRPSKQLFSSYFTI